MIAELAPRPIKALKTVLGPNGERLALLEGPTGCHRDCSYCADPKKFNTENASILEQTFRQIDWIYDQGFRVLQYVGGEPLSQHFITKEGKTFFEHTLRVVRYASEKGMLVNVSTNGDFVNEDMLMQLKEAGIDTLTFSLHSRSEGGLRYILERAKMAAKAKIPPIVSVVFTSDRTDEIPKIARRCAENGILFATTIVQEYGGGFSAVPAESKIPSPEQQRKVFDALIPLKKAGFVRNNMNYLRHAPDFPGNSWKCDPNKDPFIQIRAVGEGEIGVCSEVHTKFKVGEIDLKEKKWRDVKRDFVNNCNNCLYSCTFESQNPDLKGDLPTIAMMGFIKSGESGWVEGLGQHVVGKRSLPDQLFKPREHVLQPGVSVSVADVKKDYNWNNISNAQLGMVRLLAYMEALTIAYAGEGFLIKAIHSGTYSTQMDLVVQAIQFMSLPIGLVTYDRIKSFFRNRYVLDLKKKGLVDTKSI